MRYSYLFKRKNPRLKYNYNYRSRHLLLRYLSPREVHFLLNNVNRIKFITKLARRNIDYIEFMAFLINYTMKNSEFRKKIYKLFIRSKFKYRDYEKNINKRVNIIEKTSMDLKEIYNFEINQDDVNMYNNLFEE
jgi:hypothetical protein